MKMRFLFRILLLKCLFLTQTENCVCQNLVPNWSFEDNNDSCTNTSDPGFFENLDLWLPKRYLQGTNNAIATFSTPDYYSLCLPSVFYRPPQIGFAFQYPQEGNALVGIVYHGTDDILHDREAIRIKLNEPLKSGVCYHAEMFVNLGNNATYVCDHLGMACTVDSFPMLLDGTIAMPLPQVFTDQLISDTLNWTVIEGDFVASGGEKWLTIGWFFPTNTITYNLIGDTTALGIVTSAYYLIDAVQLYPCTDEEEAVILPNFITPNGDGKNDFYVIDSLPPMTKVSFFNRWGNEVYCSDNYQNNWDGSYLGNPLPTGTYYVIVQMPLGVRKSTFIELMY